MDDETIRKMLATWPERFFRSVQEEVDAAFAMAYRLAVDKIEAPERKHALGQLRHFRTEAGFRAAAESASMNVHVPDTMPKGGTYSVVERGNIFLLRSNVQTCRQPPRPSVFRRRWASINAYLSAFQPDLFEEVRQPTTDERLCAFLVVTSNRAGNQEVPAWVGIGIPNYDLSAWHSLTSLTEIIAAYNDVDNSHVNEVEVKIADRAKPELKKRKNGGAA